MMSAETLDETTRAEVLDKMAKTVADKFYDPNLRGIDWTACIGKHRNRIVQAGSNEAFERAISDLLSELKTSHIGFYHQRLQRATSKMAISATYAAFPSANGERWVFQDVHEHGAADWAGIRPGDVLLAVDGKEFLPPEHPSFPMGQKVLLSLISKGEKQKTVEVDVPAAKHRKRELPYAKPTIVSHRRLDSDLGLIKISMYPGVVGVEVARDISQAIVSLNPITRLIFDLRGNTGGGIGVLRVMSLLTPGTLRVGYSLSRRHVARNQDPDRFPVFNRIPSSKVGLVPLVARFANPSKPILVMTEGLGIQPFHGNVVLLVDRHTASANEMLVAFARENRLATIIGEATPGRLLSGSKFKVGHGYWLALPTGAYHTAAGKLLEGIPMEPDVYVPFDPELARQGLDPQLDRAIDVTNGSHMSTLAHPRSRG